MFFNQLRFIQLTFIVGLLIFTSCGPSKRTLAYRGELNKVVAASKNYLGTPYKYGGINHSGIDCSGLILQSYKAIDKPLPRTSKDQSKVGKKVKVKKLREGDLVFFAMGKRRRKITHVGMITAVGGGKVMFIHASSSKGVVERNLLEEYYLKTLRRSRRVLRKKDF